MKDKEFNLNERRMDLYRRLCKEYPNFKWGAIFEIIMYDDKEFIRLLKKIKFLTYEQLDEIDKLAGKSLIEGKK